MSGGKTIGPYQLQAPLGTSTVGTVYHAVHRSDGYDVALRVLPEVNSREHAERFLDEIRLFAPLENPYIVPVLDYGAQGNSVYLAMPYMTGGNLEQRVQVCKTQGRSLPSPGEVAWLLERMAYALDSIHAEGLIHHQVSPRNILCDGEGSVYLADLGLAKLFKVAYSLKLTSAVSFHQFTAPEQWEGGEITPAADQYALGLVAYLLVTGRPAFDAPTIAGLMNQHLNDVPPPPHVARPGLPPTLTNPLLGVLAKNPERRFRTVTDFYEAFAQAIEGAEGEPTGFFTFPLT